MKVEKMIECLETVYGDEISINAVYHAIAFLKAYQERVKELEEELEEAIADAAKAQKALTGDYEDSYVADCIEGELLILKSFYEEGDGQC